MAKLKQFFLQFFNKKAKKSCATFVLNLENNTCLMIFVLYFDNFRATNYNRVVFIVTTNTETVYFRINESVFYQTMINVKYNFLLKQI